MMQAERQVRFLEYQEFGSVGLRLAFWASGTALAEPWIQRLFDAVEGLVSERVKAGVAQPLDSAFLRRGSEVGDG